MDFDYAKNLRFTPGAVEAAVKALHAARASSDSKVLPIEIPFCFSRILATTSVPPVVPPNRSTNPDPSPPKKPAKIPARNMSCWTLRLTGKETRCHSQMKKDRLSVP